jgi:hypothetical protein
MFLEFVEFSGKSLFVSAIERSFIVLERTCTIYSIVHVPTLDSVQWRASAPRLTDGSAFF